MKRTNQMCLVVLLSSLLSSPLASRVPLKVAVGQDVYRAAVPGQVTMKGLLGGRMDVNREGRLKKHITEEMLLAGFRERPGSHPWIGEHIGKWLHAATLVLENKPDDTVLKEKIKRVANGLMDCQMEDGYLGTYAKENRWSAWNRKVRGSGWDVWVHKYVLIGLLSYYRVSGDERALEACRRVGDLLIQTFGDDKRDILKAGTHAGMAATSLLEPMCLLYEMTGEPKYDEFSNYIIRRADTGPGIMTNIEKRRSVQSVGNKKAYEMMSNYVGLVEHWRASGYERGLNAAKLAWESIAAENVFITGAPDAHEHFSEPYTLIPTGFCTETCVQVTWIQMNWQLLRATGDPRYAAMLHHHYYNHMLSAQHPDGINWCYMTTMEGKKDGRRGYTGTMHCCGSSGPRAIALIPTIAYMTGKDKLAVNFYETSTFKGKVNGVEVTVHQKTDYPFGDGRVSIEVEVNQPVKFDLQLLIPSFVESGELSVAGLKQYIPLEAGKYAAVRRTWSGKTQILLRFDMPIVAHERPGRRNVRYAVSRGPLVFAYEKTAKDGIVPQEVVPDLSFLDEASFDASHTMHVKGKIIASESKKAPRNVILNYKPYCEAGISGELISVWLPMLPSK